MIQQLPLPFIPGLCQYLCSAASQILALGPPDIYNIMLYKELDFRGYYFRSLDTHGSYIQVCVVELRMNVYTSMI